MPAIVDFECSRCREHISAEGPQTICPACSGLLYVRYDLEKWKDKALRPACAAEPSMWRYADVLPAVEPITLGEGWTPLLSSRRYPGLLIKDEARNPTGSFEARGMSMAVTMARHHGLRKLAVASTANAAGGVAAYAAAAAVEAHIFLPRDVSMANYLEGIACGAHPILVDRSAPDYERVVAESREREGWFDLSTDPFRIEGSKTMGYELVEQLRWRYPDAVLFPAAEEAVLIGMWKAFDEMDQLDWVSGPRPKMIAIQASGRAPRAQSPNPVGDSLLLEIVGESGGTVVDIADAQMLASLRDWARHEGLLLCPEGAAGAAAYELLLASGFLGRSDRVVLINPASALKYTDTIAEAMQLSRPGAKKYPQRTPVGGIITPQ